MKTCSNLDIKQIFTSYNNPKGNADTERMIRTMKEELFWLREWENEKELTQELDKWVEYYNKMRLFALETMYRLLILMMLLTLWATVTPMMMRGTLLLTAPLSHLLGPAILQDALILRRLKTYLD